LPTDLRRSPARPEARSSLAAEQLKGRRADGPSAPIERRRAFPTIFTDTALASLMTIKQRPNLSLYFIQRRAAVVSETSSNSYQQIVDVFVRNVAGILIVNLWKKSSVQVSGLLSLQLVAALRQQLGDGGGRQRAGGCLATDDVPC